MIPRIKVVKPLPDHMLGVLFDDGKTVLYDVKDDIDSIEDYRDLMVIGGLFEQVQLDQSRTCVFWNDRIDLPSDTIYEYGQDWDADLTKAMSKEAKQIGAAEPSGSADEAGSFGRT